MDETGFPLTEGLVRLYSEGVQDRNYYYAAFTAVQQCIGIAEAVKQQQPNKKFGNFCNFLGRKHSGPDFEFSTPEAGGDQRPKRRAP